MASPTISCAHCGEAADPTAKFCARCGTPLPNSPSTACAHCQGALEPGAKFCGRCGTPIVAASSVHQPGAPLSPEELSTADAKCSHCRHLEARNICGSSQSPHYRQSVEATDRCDFFVVSAAQIHFLHGSVSALEGQHEAAVADIDIAIRLGLPHDKEMTAQSFLGEEYLQMARARCHSSQEYAASPHIARAIKHIEKALFMDRAGAYAYFSEPLNRARLRQLDLMYNVVADAVTQNHGRQTTIGYLQQKVALSAYLPSCPLLHALLKLGALYVLEKQRERARVCLQNLLAAAPVDIVDESGEERRVREQAREGLRSIL
jgi:tetratricopeptide (TPR) repeat protein